MNRSDAFGDTSRFMDVLPPERCQPKKPPAVTPKPRPKKRRPVRTWVLVFLLCAGSVEGASWLGYYILTGNLLSFTAARETQQGVAKASSSVDIDGLADGTTQEMMRALVHPYLGYIRPQNDPHAVPGQDYLLGKKPLITGPSVDTAVVGIFGGSFAEHFSDQGRGVLQKLLATHPKFSGKHIEIVTVASAGYKQPQHLLALNYLLSLGQHFDMIVNIDGFNEIAGPPVENLSRQVSPFFPTGWYHLADRLPDMNILTGIGTVAYQKSRRKELAEAILGSGILQRSAAVQLLWEGLDRRVAADVSVAQLALKNMPPSENNAKQLVGPAYTFGSEEKLLADLVGQWERSSLLMHELASAHDIPYIHLLQPNQYVAGSKSYTKEEKLTAISSSSPYARWVAAGYPFLREAGGRLASRGVAFTDLSYIFQNVTETVYKDDCCHINTFGNAIVGAAVVDLIETYLPYQGVAMDL